MLKIVEDFKDADLFNADAFRETGEEMAVHDQPLSGPYVAPPKPGDPVADGTHDSLLDG